MNMRLATTGVAEASVRAGRLREASAAELGGGPLVARYDWDGSRLAVAVRCVAERARGCRGLGRRLRGDELPRGWRRWARRLM